MILVLTGATLIILFLVAIIAYLCGYTWGVEETERRWSEAMRDRLEQARRDAW